MMAGTKIFLSKRIGGKRLKKKNWGWNADRKEMTFLKRKATGHISSQSPKRQCLLGVPSSHNLLADMTVSSQILLEQPLTKPCVDLYRMFLLILSCRFFFGDCEIQLVLMTLANVIRFGWKGLSIEMLDLRSTSEHGIDLTLWAREQNTYLYSNFLLSGRHIFP